MNTSRYFCMVASAIMLSSIVSAAPVMAASGSPDAQSIIKAKTGSNAVQVTEAQNVKGLSLGVGHDKSGKFLPSFAQTAATRVRMMSELDSPSQTEANFALGMPYGARIVRMPDGGMLVVADRAGPKAISDVLGSISAPWATDANGVNLTTSYAYHDGVLTQSVDTTGAAFPVVADPSLTFGWGVYFNLYGFEIKSIMSLVIGGGEGALVVACLGSKLPHWVAKVVMTLCTIFGGPSVWSILVAIYNFWKIRTVNTYWCYQKEIVPMIGGWVAVRGAYPSTQNCRV